MNILSPEDIEWKLQTTMALSNEHRMDETQQKRVMRFQESILK